MFYFKAIFLIFIYFFLLLRNILKALYPLLKSFAELRRIFIFASYQFIFCLILQFNCSLSFLLFFYLGFSKLFLLSLYLFFFFFELSTDPFLRPFLLIFLIAYFYIQLFPLCFFTNIPVL